MPSSQVRLQEAWASNWPPASSAACRRGGRRRELGVQQPPVTGERAAAPAVGHGHGVGDRLGDPAQRVGEPQPGGRAGGVQRHRRQRRRDRQPGQQRLRRERHRVHHADLGVGLGRRLQHLPQPLGARRRVHDDGQLALAGGRPQRGQHPGRHLLEAAAHALGLPRRAAAQRRQLVRARSARPTPACRAWRTRRVAPGPPSAGPNIVPVQDGEAHGVRPCSGDGPVRRRPAARAGPATTRAARPASITLRPSAVAPATTGVGQHGGDVQRRPPPPAWRPPSAARPPPTRRRPAARLLLRAAA